MNGNFKHHYYCVRPTIRKVRISKENLELVGVNGLNGYLVPQFLEAIFTSKNAIWADKTNHVSLNFSSTTTYVRTKKIGGGYTLRMVSC